MVKLNEFINKIIDTYSIVYFIILQILSISILSYSVVISMSNIPSIILSIIGITIMYILLNVFFLIPIISSIALGTIISFFMTVSIPLFLFFSFFEVIGSESINVLEYGFFKTLMFCILITPIGYLNLKSLVIFNKYMTV